MKRSRGMIVAFVLAALTSMAGTSEAAEIGWHGLEARGGAVFPADWDDGWTVAVAADLGEITGGLRLYPGVSYSKAETSDSVDLFGLPFRVDQEITSLALGAEVRWYVSGGQDGWYAGGGPYVHRLEYEQALIVGGVAGTSTVETDALGIVGVAGYSFGGRFNVEARYDTVSDLQGAQLLVGIRFGG